MIDRPEALLFVSLTRRVITSDGCFQGADSRKSQKYIFI